MAANIAGLVVYGLTSAVLMFVVLFSERDRGFPLPLARRACAVVLGIDSALAWIAIGADASLVRSPGWLMSVGLAGAANLVAALGTLLRAVSMPLWLRVVAGCALFAAVPLLAILTL